MQLPSLGLCLAAFACTSELGLHTLRLEPTEDSDPGDKPSPSEPTAKKPTLDLLVHAKDIVPKLK